MWRRRRGWINRCVLVQKSYDAIALIPDATEVHYSGLPPTPSFVVVGLGILGSAWRRRELCLHLKRLAGVQYGFAQPSLIEFLQRGAKYGRP